MSRATLERHREIWNGKPVLQAVYRVWFDRLLAHVPDGARVLEVGAGPGLLAEHARRARADLWWHASDGTGAPWNGLAADAQRLPLRSAAVDAVVAFDVIHHLARPGDFLAECGRVLRPGGRLLAVEPWVSPFSHPIYRWLHQEGCRTAIDPWAPFAGGKDAFDGNAAVVPLLLRRTPPGDFARFGLGAPRLERWNAFAYLLSLGFRERSLLPRPLLAPLVAIDRASEPLAALFALRALVEWRRLP